VEPPARLTYQPPAILPVASQESIMKLKNFVKRINAIELACEIGSTDSGTIIIHAVVPGTHKSLASFIVEGDTLIAHRDIDDVIHALSDNTFCN
jgi:hypothetical protein